MILTSDKSWCPARSRSRAGALRKLLSGHGQFSFGLGCNCCAPCADVTMCVHGCGGQNLVGATVTISSGGTTISTGTTISGGCVDLSIPSNGTYTVTINATGFNTYTTSQFLTCGDTYTHALTASSLYQCCGGCAASIPNTLNWSESYYGVSGTATWQTSGLYMNFWYGSATVTVPAGTLCMGIVKPKVGFMFNCGEMSIALECAGDCPETDTIGSIFTLVTSPPFTSCPPTFSMTASWSPTSYYGTNCLGDFLGGHAPPPGTTWTWTFSE